jgi:Methyltransferase domain
VERYYSARLAEHGATARGVDWNSRASQDLRFEQLLKVCGDRCEFSLNDYGCGYGALISALERRGVDFAYQGFDVSATMLECARHAYGRHPCVTFVDSEDDLGIADYTVASGIFNVKIDVPKTEWEEYVMATLDTLARLSSRGFSFNMLTSYADRDKMRPDLYYGDPGFYFDRCTKYSRNVALLHDYRLYEFTMITRFDE